MPRLVLRGCVQWSSQAALRHVCDAIAAVEWQVEKNKDNILPRIMAVSGSYDKLFAEELKKYEPLKVRFIPSFLHLRCLRVCQQMYGLMHGRGLQSC